MIIVFLLQGMRAAALGKVVKKGPFLYKKR
jgi:hypothetical protein